ncbi:MAG: GntR family transcriptional regulator [Burkholderiaceae bacterium]
MPPAIQPRVVMATDNESVGSASSMADAPKFAPLYRQIHNLLTRELQAGKWRAGEMIPTEQALARQYKVSAGTVRKAIDQLVAENILKRRQGRGTFVSTHREARSQFRFLRLRDQQDRVPMFTSRILSCRRARAQQEVARALQIKAGEATVHIRRVLDFEGIPTVLDEIWLPGNRFRGLTLDVLDAHDGPLYVLFETQFNTRTIQGVERVSATVTDKTSAGILKVETGSPILSVERISETYEGQPVEFRHGLYRTDRHRYRSELR